MADNVTIPATGSGDATPKVSTRQESGDSAHTQTVNNGLLKRIAVSPTIGTSAYASGDFVGTEMDFANAVRSSGWGGWVVGCAVNDEDAERGVLELWLFKAAITEPSDNAAWNVSDADMSHFIGVIPITQYFSGTINSGGMGGNLPMPFVLDGTSLYGYLVIRSASTYTATSDLEVILTILQE